MVGTVAEFDENFASDGLATAIGTMYDEGKNAREGWEQETKELRDYVFATDTSTTSNQTLPWSNKTHVPKITQIYDNLKANYMSALFPHDDWLSWLAGSAEAADMSVARTVRSYMVNKLREDNFYTTVSRLIDDYVLYGNAFVDTEFVNESSEDPLTGETVPGYIGPRAVRISPYDMAFNPLAPRFVDSPKITRTLWQLGEFEKYAESMPEDSGWINEALSNMKELRSMAAGTSYHDFRKLSSLEVDGFSSYWTYLRSGFVEVLELTGDIYNPDTGEFEKDQIITVADRTFTLRKEVNPSWFGKSTIHHVGWRERPDNLWAMSPLANVVGLQYRINHIENSKADAIDLNILPPIKIRGEVEDYVWGPGEEIQVSENGDVALLSPDLTALSVDQEIQYLMDLMELFTGAPREAMGVRSPGEKTAFEVQSLVTAASRIFQEKIRNFEINLLEPLLNTMLEVAKRNIDGSDVVRVIDDDLGVQEFITVTKEDITAAGKLRPVGARHFARQAQIAQNLIGLANSAVWPVIQPHVSRKALARLAEELMGLDRFNLFGENVGLMEDAESAMVAQSVQQEMAQQGAPVDEQGMAQGPQQGAGEPA
jgi:hypothetical protein